MRRRLRETHHLHLLLKPLDELRECPATVGDFVLLHLGHFGIRLAFILEARIPALLERKVSNALHYTLDVYISYQSQLAREPPQSYPTHAVNSLLCSYDCSSEI